MIELVPREREPRDVDPSKHEITVIGTRTPSPIGPSTKPCTPVMISCAMSTVDRRWSREADGTGGTMWSKKPSFSSNITRKPVLLQTSGFEVSAASTQKVRGVDAVAGVLRRDRQRAPDVRECRRGACAEQPWRKVRRSCA